jgi:hypothetical protein
MFGRWRSMGGQPLDVDTRVPSSRSFEPVFQYARECSSERVKTSITVVAIPARSNNRRYRTTIEAVRNRCRAAKSLPNNAFSIGAFTRKDRPRAYKSFAEV